MLPIKGKNMMMTTETIAILPMIKALAQATLFASGTQTLPDTWHQEFMTKNDKQQTLMRTYAPTHKELSWFSQEELGAWASTNNVELNDILKSKNFDIQLEPFTDGFGMVSILDMKTQWRRPGSPTTIFCPNTKDTYQGVEMKKGFSVYESPNHVHPIAKLYTKSGDTIFLTEATEQKSNFELLNTIQRIKADLQDITFYFASGVLQFPKAAVNHQPDVSWIEEMGIDTYSKYSIKKAKQQTKFNLDEIGAEVKSAFACITEEQSGCERQDLIINKPYIAWRERENVSIPVVAALIAHDSWQKK